MRGGAGRMRGGGRYDEGGGAGMMGGQVWWGGGAGMMRGLSLLTEKSIKCCCIFHLKKNKFNSTGALILILLKSSNDFLELLIIYYYTNFFLNVTLQPYMILSINKKSWQLLGDFITNKNILLLTNFYLAITKFLSSYWQIDNWYRR